MTIFSSTRNVSNELCLCAECRHSPPHSSHATLQACARLSSVICPNVLTHLANPALDLEDGLVGRGAQIKEAVVESVVLAHRCHELTLLCGCFHLRFTVRSFEKVVNLSDSSYVGLVRTVYIRRVEPYLW